MKRHAGLIIPLFSATSTHSWGIGEIGDVAPLAAWMSAAAFDRLMLLPLGTMAPGQSSPYSAQSAMAIDPIYLSVESIEDFQRAGGTAALSEAARHHLQLARSSTRVEHASVRAAKHEALVLAFDEFVRHEWEEHTTRAGHLAAYAARERWWLDDYALFEAIAVVTAGQSWRDWPASIRDRDPRALDETRRQLAREVLRYQYLQWIAESQWQQARVRARDHGVLIYGDLPFVVAAHSADVWARQQEFLLDVSVGVPPDAFTPDGQDWGLPMYRWDLVRANDFTWLRQRARRMAALFDGIRVDHLVGFYRTYGRPPAGGPFFLPAGEAAQLQQGEDVLRIFLASGAEIIAEDLGTIPEFVPASLARLGVPGCKVLRWQTDPPAHYPAVSAAMTGTHDTETVAAWWDHSPRAERARWVADPSRPWSPELRDALLGVAYGAGSNHLFVPVQDVFGWHDRINTPATVGNWNWTWRLPWPVDRLNEVPDAVERAAFCRHLATVTGR